MSVTLLIAFQGRNCALLASDLLVDFVTREQLALPPDQRAYLKVLCQKVRPTCNGDYMAYSGTLNSDENRHVYGKSLADLLARPPWEDPDVRPNVFASLFYASFRDAQLYVGTPTVPFGSVTREHPFWCTPVADSSVSSDLSGVTGSLMNATVRRDRGFLRELSYAWGEEVLRAEGAAESFGGYASYLFLPGKVTRLTRRPGILKGCPEGWVNKEGLLCAELPLTPDAVHEEESA